MNPPSDQMFSRFNGQPGANEQAIMEAEKTFSLTLPEDYKTFLKSYNGGEGFIGEHYFIHWKIEELVTYNHEYGARKYAPELVLFGSDGGGESFAFDTRSEPYPVVMVPFIGMSLSDSLVVAKSFTHLLERMLAVKGSLLRCRVSPE